MSKVIIVIDDVAELGVAVEAHSVHDDPDSVGVETTAVLLGRLLLANADAFLRLYQINGAASQELVRGMLRDGGPARPSTVDRTKH